MTVADALLADLRSRGVELETDGSRIRWRPASLVSAPEAERIRAHRAELIDRLEDPGGADALRRCPACRRFLDSRRRCPKCFDRLCEGCGRPTGSYFIARCFACGHALSDEPGGQA